MDVIFRKVG